MDAPFISVIIPVYNTAAYLPACLDSLLNQTFTDWEAICVNDGSKDDSLAILQQYAAKDTRFRIINQDNTGVSAARNHGLAAASGVYVTMVDSDDVLPPMALSHLAEPGRQAFAPDLVIGGMRWVKTAAPTEHSVTKVLTYDAKQEGLFNNRAFAVGHISGLPSGKLYKRSLIETFSLRYNRDLKVGEDHEFLIRFIMRACSFYAVEEPVYDYIMRENSTMGKYDQGKEKYQVYEDFSLSKARLIPKLLQFDWRREEQRDFAESLLFFYWRDWVRSSFALIRRPLALLHLSLRIYRGLSFFAPLLSHRDCIALYRNNRYLPYTSPYTFLLHLYPRLWKNKLKRLLSHA